MSLFEKFLLGLLVNLGFTALLAWPLAAIFGTGFIATWVVVFIVIGGIRYATNHN